MLGLGVLDRNDLEKYPCISFIRNTNKIQQGQDEQSKWFKKDECLKILKTIKTLRYGTTDGNENILCEKEIFDDTLLWVNKGKGSLENHNLFYDKVGCAFPMDISSDFRVGQHTDGGHQEYAIYYII